LKHSVLGDLDSLGPMATRAILRTARGRLGTDPLATTRHLKSLQANAIAERQLSVLGRYRVLFTVDEAAKVVTIVVVGEKRGNAVRAGQEIHRT
jgi:mRNA-degrading endonuclease RelE of RelBE toxin-antitoxin system